MNTLECIKTRHSTRKFKAESSSIKCSTLVAALRLVAIHN
mgnify:CR=1 FL=1